MRQAIRWHFDDQARARIRYLPTGGVTPPADLSAALHRLTGWALEQHVDLNGLEVIRPSLEDVYLQLTDDPAVQRGAEPATTTPAGGKGRRRS